MGTATGTRQSRMILSEINVTPFVDVMLVLLIIFMATAPMMQQGLEVDLPQTSNSGIPTQEQPFILVIRQNRELIAGTAKLSLANLQGKLKALFSTRKNKQIYIQADKRVDYGFVAEVMGEVRSAGIHQVGLITLPKAGL